MEKNLPLMILAVCTIGTGIFGVQVGDVFAQDTQVPNTDRPNFQQQTLSPSPTSARWSWLKNSYWYVPTPSLQAFVFDSTQQLLTPVRDQTVFHITGYYNGYFWGKTAVNLGSSTIPSLSCLSLVGSVTPEGRVFLTFTPADATPVSTVTQGFGQMRNAKDNWQMEPQMSSGPNALTQVVHWAYMTKCRPNDLRCQSLPGVGVSIDALLAQCPPGPHLLGQ